uniref:Protein interacting with cyclin A1 n=1 Tax=Microcebus murinus TaxID=30608 RepID=A0A8C5VVT2_MICMU
MWVRTTVTIERWTEEDTECKAKDWDESESSGAKAIGLCPWQ